MDMDKFRTEIITEDKENIKKKVLEEGYNAAHGYVLSDSEVSAYFLY